MHKKITSWKTAKKIRRRQKKITIVKKGLKFTGTIILYGITFLTLYFLIIMSLSL